MFGLQTRGRNGDQNSAAPEHIQQGDHCSRLAHSRDNDIVPLYSRILSRLLDNYTTGVPATI